MLKPSWEEFNNDPTLSKNILMTVVTIFQILDDQRRNVCKKQIPNDIQLDFGSKTLLNPLKGPKRAILSVKCEIQNHF